LGSVDQLRRAIDGAARFAERFAGWRGRRAFARHGHDGLWGHRPPDAIAPVWSDLWFLYRLVRRIRPATVLEFGSGCSTIAIAQALADNAETGGGGRLYSLDAEARWAAATAASLPPHLDPFVDLCTAPVVPHSYAGTPVWRHLAVPQVVPHLVYVDGPALTAERRAASDVLDMQDRLPVGCRILVDGRSQQVRLLDANWRRPVRRRRSRVLRHTLYEVLA